MYRFTTLATLDVCADVEYVYGSICDEHCIVSMKCQNVTQIRAELMQHWEILINECLKRSASQLADKPKNFD